ncbi:hypothetical protein D3C72_1691000 [compost metagenome]
MRAAVFEHGDLAAFGAHHDDRAGAYPVALVATDLRHLAFQADIVPGLAVEEDVHLLLEHGRIGVDPVGYTGMTFGGPAAFDMDRLLGDGRRVRGTGLVGFGMGAGHGGFQSQMGTMSEVRTR